eukprot:scaffold227633_cov31-Tisochrysis_lutea.AAC.3
MGRPLCTRPSCSKLNISKVEGLKMGSLRKKTPQRVPHVPCMLHKRHKRTMKNTGRFGANTFTPSMDPRYGLAATGPPRASELGPSPWGGESGSTGHSALGMPGGWGVPPPQQGRGGGRGGIVPPHG